MEIDTTDTGVSRRSAGYPRNGVGVNHSCDEKCGAAGNQVVMAIAYTRIECPDPADDCTDPEHIHDPTDGSVWAPSREPGVEPEPEPKPAPAPFKPRRQRKPRFTWSRD